MNRSEPMQSHEYVRRAQLRQKDRMSPCNVVPDEMEAGRGGGQVKDKSFMSHVSSDAPCDESPCAPYSVYGI